MLLILAFDYKIFKAILNERHSHNRMKESYFHIFSVKFHLFSFDFPNENEDRSVASLFLQNVTKGTTI